MCNTANPILDKGTPLRISANSRFRGLPRGVRPCLAKSARRGSVSRFSLCLSGVVGLLLLGASSAAWAQVTFNGAISTLGTPGLTLYGPSDIAVDSSGNAYIADTNNGRVVKVNPQGSASALKITGLSPALSRPYGIAVDGEGKLYITDPVNNRVVEVRSEGGIASVLNTGSASLSGPDGVAVDASGNIFVADTGHNRIVEVTFGGTASVPGITVSSGPTKLSSPHGLAVDISGSLYIADTGNGRIVDVPSGSAVGDVLSVTGAGSLSGPNAVAVDSLGNIYIADESNSHIVKVTPAGAGSVLSTEPVTLIDPAGIAVDNYGTVYITDAGDSRVVTVATSAVGFGHLPLGSASGATQTLRFTVEGGTTLGAVDALTVGAQNLDFTVGSGTTCASGTTDATCTVNLQFLPRAPGLRRGAVVLYDSATPPNPLLNIPLYAFADAPVAALAPHTAAVISTGSVSTAQPFQIALDGSGNMYVRNDVASNVLKVVAGGGTGSVVSSLGASLAAATGVALDGAGNLFIADQHDNRIVTVTPGGLASALSISGLSTALDNPTALAFDGAGSLYIADSHNGRIVKVSSLVAGGSNSSGVGSVVRTGSFSLGNVTGVAVSPAGTVYIADPSNDRVIQVTAAGAASVLNPSGLTFSDPQGVGVDGMGNIYVADSGNNRIVGITTAGIASVVSTPGLPSPSALNHPTGVTVDPFGNVFIPDANNNRIVEVPVSSASLAFPSTRVGLATTPSTATVTNLGNQPLVFAANPTYPANFSLNPDDADLCTSATTLLAGTVCDVSVKFTPQSVVSLSAGITLTNNALNVNHSTQQVSAIGTALDPADTTATTVSAIPSSLSVGQAATLTAVVSDTASGHASTVPTGQVSFTDTVGSTLTSLNNGLGVNLTAGQATLTGVVLRGVGVHTITAVYSGVTGSFLTSTGTATATLNQSSVTLVVQPAHVVFGQTGSVAVTVTGAYTTIAAPSGTISYSILDASSASVASGTITLTVGSTSSTATFSVPSTLTPGSYTVSVTYSGDSNYLGHSYRHAGPFDRQQGESNGFGGVLAKSRVGDKPGYLYRYRLLDGGHSERVRQFR